MRKNKSTTNYTNYINYINYTKHIIPLLLLLLISCIVYFIEWDEQVSTSIQTRSLYNDGFLCMFNKNYLKTQNIPCEELRRDVLQKLPKGYTFLDYTYKIENTSLSTFHRDVTSSQHIYKTKYPVYTAILYKYDGEFLSVCPRSNKTYPFVMSHIVNISGKSGTIFLFDSELLHAGMKNGCKKREVIQYKICHQDDLHLLQHLQKVRAYKKDDVCKNNILYEIMRKMSYYFQLPTNTVLYPLMIKRENNNSMIGIIQSYIPLSYYNNI